MRRIASLSLVLFILLGAYGVSHAVTIDSITFDGCISEAGKTPISVVATDPAGGILSYDWEILNGTGTAIIGSGSDVVFDPPNTGPHPCPYRIKLTVTSSASGLFAEKIIEISVKVAGDVTGDGNCNASDLAQIRNHFMETGTPGWIDADLNSDGRVNVLDLVLLRNTFMQKSACLDPGTYFFDNFECGLTKWTVNGVDWGLTDSAFMGGKSSLTDSPGGDYAPHANVVVTMKYSVDLSTATQPVLSFWHKHMLDYYNLYGNAYYDYAYVEVSTNGGASWAKVGSWVGFQSTWTQQIIDLSSYKGSAVKIRFRLYDSYGYTSDGWYIDNVEIKELNDTGPLLPYPFSDDFEQGLDNWATSGVDWALVSSATLGGAYAITDSPTGNYPAWANTTLTTAGSIDLAAAVHPVLTFWHKYSLDYYDLYGNQYFDHAYVDVSTDAGRHWTNIAAWTREQISWTQQIVDLSSYKGKAVKIRFRVSDGYGYNANGWYLDKVEVKEFSDAVPLLSYPFSDAFEEGLDKWLTSGVDWALYASATLGGASAITDSPGGNYPAYANTTLTTAGSIDLTTATQPVLSFWHKYSLKSYSQDGRYDYAYVDASTDGGFTWTNVGSWTGRQSTWTQQMIDLSSYAGNAVKLRFRVRDTHGFSDGGWSLDKVEVKELSDTVPLLSYPFSDAFEEGLDKWLVSGVDWALYASAALGGAYAIADSPGQNYPPYANTTLTTAGSIDLTLATHPVLSFWHKYLLESYAHDGEYDYAYVDVSIDGGFTWTNVGSWTGRQSTWTQQMVDLSSYSGNAVKLRFRLRDAYNFSGGGWSLDKVEVKELSSAISLLSYPFLDDFEHGLGNWVTSGVDWALIASATLGGAYAITDSPGGNYPAYANTTLTTAGPIDLSTATHPVLSFWHKYSLEYSSYDGTYDRAYVDASTDGGLTWANVASWKGDLSTWTQQIVDLGSYTGNAVKLRFRVRDSYGYSGNGWYIDYVEVCESE